MQTKTVIVHKICVPGCTGLWPFSEALMIAAEGSHLKQGSMPAILIVITDDRVPSRAELFLALVL